MIELTIWNEANTILNSYLKHNANQHLGNLKRQILYSLPQLSFHGPEGDSNRPQTQPGFRKPSLLQACLMFCVLKRLPISFFVSYSILVLFCCLLGWAFPCFLTFSISDRKLVDFASATAQNSVFVGHMVHSL